MVVSRNRSAAFTTSEVAKLSYVSEATARKWMKSGLLPSYAVPGGKHRRVLREDLLHFLRSHGMPTGEAEKT